MRWLSARLSMWRGRPLLAAVVVSFFALWALRIPTQRGSTWDSFLAHGAWFLLICWVVASLLDARSDNTRPDSPVGRRDARRQYAGVDSPYALTPHDDRTGSRKKGGGE